MRLILIVCGVVAVLMLAYVVFDQRVARLYGGNISVTVPANESLLAVNWKNDELWITSKLPNGCIISRENSELGVFEGSVTVCNQP